MPQEFFKDKIQYKSYIFPMVSIIAFFIEKNYIYDISNSDFINIQKEDVNKFFDLCNKNKNLFSSGMNPDITLRTHEISEKYVSDSKNMTSIQDLPQIFSLKSNKLIIYNILKKISCFVQEYIFYLNLIK
jgi:hypothetical protein